MTEGHHKDVVDCEGSVLDYPGKACECGRRKAIIGGGARWL